MRSHSAALGLLLALTYSVHAAAEEPTGTGQEPPPTAPAEASAPTLTGTTEADAKAAEVYRQGAAALKAGRHEEAYEKFQQAWQLKKHFQLAANLGAVELWLGKHRDAAEHLAYFMREAPDGFQEERQQVEQMFAEARQHVGALKIQVEDGAEVFVDSRSMGTAPLEQELFVEPGRRVVEARREGFERARADVEASAGASQEVRIALKPMVQQRKAPEVRGARGGGDAADMRAGDSQAANWQTWAAAGIALAGIGAGVGFTLAAIESDRRADTALEEARAAAPEGQVACPEGTQSRECSALTGVLTEETLFVSGAVAGYVVGGVAAVVMARRMIWQPQRTGRGLEVRVAPKVSLDGGGLLVNGTF